MLATPVTNTYTNNLDSTEKTTAAYATPDVLDAKLNVAGSLTKTLVTNAGAVSITLSNPGPLHVNAARVISWSTNGQTSLLDGSITLPAGSLLARSVLRIEAFGSFSDPGGSSPLATLRLKLGATTIVVQSDGVGSVNWHLSAALTIRSAGSSGLAVGTLAVSQDDSSAAPFSMASQTATVNTTGSLAFDL